MTQESGVSLGTGRALRETDKALLVELELHECTIWIPKSQIHDDSEVFDADDNAEGNVVVERWFAEKEGLV